jgi:hypothetical protein
MSAITLTRTRREPRVHCGQHRDKVIVSQNSGFEKLDASTAVIVVLHAEIMTSEATRLRPFPISRTPSRGIQDHGLLYVSASRATRLLPENRRQAPVRRLSRLALESYTTASFSDIRARPYGDRRWLRCVYRMSR